LERKPFLIPMIVMMFCWLPIWLANFPGTLTIDSSFQLAQFRGVVGWHDNHPLLGTFIYGSLLNIGRSVLNDSFGVFLIVLVQKLLFAGACALALIKLKSWGVSLKLRFVFLIFWALNPIFPYQLQVVLKDNISTALLMFFFVLFIDFIKNTRQDKWNFKRMLIGLGVLISVGILAALIRHNNSYIVVVSLLALLFLRQRDKSPKTGNLKRRLAVALAVILSFFGINAISSVLVNATGADTGCISEALSVPFQQTARFVREHPELVTPEERAALDEVFEFDYLAEKYNPWLSDPVKNLFRGDTSTLPSYMGLWFRMGLRRPLTYFAATIENSYAFFAPVKTYPFDRGYTRIHCPEMLREDERFYAAFNFHDSSQQPSRAGFQRLFEAFRQIPGINLFFSLAHYTWFILFLMLILLKKRKLQSLIAFVPVLALILTCVAGPVNGEVRYFWAAIAATPLLAGWVWYNLIQFTPTPADVPPQDI